VRGSKKPSIAGRLKIGKPLRSAQRGGIGAWLLKGLGALILAFLVLTVVPVLIMRWVPPFSSAFMMASQLIGTPVDYRWVDLEEISPYAALAVIASEDQLFPFHTGFDMKSIRQAVRQNAHRKRPRGASTISQQVAKNLFLWNGASYVRKGIEAYLTVLIEALWPKERILEVYLNIAEFGPGVYGVEAESMKFWR
jgi:monofunctional biosynthetic peptidoglycan transglycosylase